MKNVKYSAPLNAIVSRLSNTANHDKLRPILMRLTETSLMVDNLEKLIVSRNPMDTEAAHMKKVAVAAAKLKFATNKNLSGVLGVNASAREELTQEIKHKAKLAPTESASEIRSVLRGLSLSERIRVVQEAAAGGDSEVLSAVLCGNTLTTGINDKLRTELVNQHTRRVAPELLEQMNILDEVAEIIPKFFELAESAADESTDPERMAELASLEEKAEQAQSDFNQSIEGNLSL